MSLRYGERTLAKFRRRTVFDPLLPVDLSGLTGRFVPTAVPGGVGRDRPLRLREPTPRPILVRDRWMLEADTGL